MEGQLKDNNLPTNRENVSKVLGKMWRELPEEHKSLYVQSAQAEYHQRYPTRYKRQKAAEKRQEKTVAAQQTTSAGSGFCPQERTWRQAACRRLRGLPPSPSSPSSPSTLPQPQTLTSIPEPSSPQPTIAPLTTELEAGPLPNSAPDSATDLVSEYMAADGDHYVPSARKMPVNPQAAIRHLPPDEDLLKQLDEFFGSGPAMSSEIPNTLPVHHDPPKEMDLPGSSCSEPSVCVSPSDLVLLRESSCSPASRGAVKRSTTKKRKRGTYTPWTKAKTRRTRASKPTSSQAQDTMEASQENADDLKTPSSSSSSVSLDLMEPSSSAYGSISGWDWDARLDRDNVPNTHDSMWDVPLADLWKDIPDLSSDTGFDTSVRKDHLPPPSEPWSDEVWDTYFQLDATV